MFKKILLSGLIFLVSLSAWAVDNTSKNSDSAITANIKQKLDQDKTLAASNLGVTTEEGVVSLSGNLKTDKEAANAAEIAQSVNGVKDVDTSNLTVQDNKQSITDTIITAKVLGTFMREKVFGDKPIVLSGVKVETKNGEVFLFGVVGDQVQATNAEQLAKNVGGVKKVTNKLTIEKSSSQN